MSALDEIHDDLQTAIRDVLLKHGHMAGTFVIIGEAIEADSGERFVLRFATEDARRWDTLGLLSYAIGLENAGIARDGAELD